MLKMGDLKPARCAESFQERNSDFALRPGPDPQDRASALAAGPSVARQNSQWLPACPTGQYSRSRIPGAGSSRHKPDGHIPHPNDPPEAGPSLDNPEAAG